MERVAASSCLAPRPLPPSLDGGSNSWLLRPASSWSLAHRDDANMLPRARDVVAGSLVREGPHDAEARAVGCSSAWMSGRAPSVPPAPGWCSACLAAEVTGEGGT